LGTSCDANAECALLIYFIRCEMNKYIYVYFMYIQGVITSDEECVLCQDFVKELDTLMEDSSKQVLYTVVIFQK
jgi:hypothetical protein